MVHHQQLPTNSPTKQNKAWWNQFGFVQKKKDTTVQYTYYQRTFDVGERSTSSFLLTELRFFQAHDSADHPVFGKPLRESLRYASVQISTANASGDLYVWGYIPVVVAKWYILSLLFLSLFTSFFVAITIVVFISRKTVRSYCSLMILPHRFRAATEVPGTFRVNGSSRRMRDLQAEFERPPRVCTIS